ncbi:unnamed protein product [Dracunculus medinensis]|uniref:Neuropeptide-Like Protein n=1 Tax=Dracunculus medinensis TaxID=318479 RepID=A0A0N4URY1_DRAME|nr:unnamed protein product [Dracunculus medinensis]
MKSMLMIVFIVTYTVFDMAFANSDENAEAQFMNIPSDELRKLVKRSDTVSRFFKRNYDRITNETRGIYIFPYGRRQP